MDNTWKLNSSLPWHKEQPEPKNLMKTVPKSPNRIPCSTTMPVRGYKEEGATTAPFDMVVLNQLDRFHLVQDVIDHLPQLGSRAACAKQAIQNTCSNTANTSMKRATMIPWFSLGGGASRLAWP